MQRLELLVPPPALLALFAGLMAILAERLPGAGFTVPGRLLLAAALGCLGLAIAAAGVAAFRRNRTTANPMRPDKASSLVTSGIYRVTRNPMYLGLLLALAGWSLYLANWAAALLLPVFVATMNRLQIGPEERALERKFGEDFVGYRRRVRRWL